MLDASFNHNRNPVSGFDGINTLNQSEKKPDEHTPWVMLDLVPVGIQILSREGKFLYCNEQTHTMFGVVSQGDLIGKNYTVLSPPSQSNGRNSQVAFFDLINQAFSRDSVTATWEYQKFNGEVFPARITLNRITYEGKDSLMATISDISELVEEINARETLIREAPVSILTVTPTVEIANFNPAYLAVTNYSAKDAIDLGFKGQKVLSREGESIEEARRSKETVNGKFVCNFGSGIKHLRYSYIPVLNKKNEITHFYHIMLDQTDMVNKINEFEALIAGSPAGIITMDPDTSILSSNQALSDISGLSLSQLTSMKSCDFTVLSRTGGSVADVLQSKRSEGGRITFDFGKRVRILEYTYIPILDTNGKVVKVYTQFVDLTAINRMVEYLEKSVNVVAGYVNNLSEGKTDFTPKPLPADEFTESAYQSFVTITGAIDKARLAIEKIVGDCDALTDAAVTGNLSYRSDPAHHLGNFRTIIEGINNILDTTLIPVHEAMRVSKEYSQYQFKCRFNPNIKIQGDWIEFRQALDAIGVDVSRAISVLAGKVQELSANIEEANASIEEITSGTGEISSTMESINQHSENGDHSVTQIIGAMTDLSHTVGAVAQKSDAVASLSQEANGFAINGMNLAKKSNSSMNEIIQSTQHVDFIIKDINIQMGEIGKIVNLISDIASQTNLLSLNAAIEAARAGEAGRGFAVVAAEVKSLAQDSRKSATNISEMIQSLQNKAKSAGEAMTSSLGVVHEGNVALSEMVTSFNQIATKIEEINKNTMDVAASSEEQAASVEEITATMQEVSSVIHKTSKEVTMTAAAITQTSASLDQITQVVSSIVQIGEGVSQEISRFTI